MAALRNVPISRPLTPPPPPRPTADTPTRPRWTSKRRSTTVAAHRSTSRASPEAHTGRGVAIECWSGCYPPIRDLSENWKKNRKKISSKNINVRPLRRKYNRTDNEEITMVQVRYTRNLFLRGISIIYVFAFLSFYIQIPGKKNLSGANGFLNWKSAMKMTNFSFVGGFFGFCFDRFRRVWGWPARRGRLLFFRSTDSGRNAASARPMVLADRDCSTVIEERRFSGSMRNLILSCEFEYWRCCRLQSMIVGRIFSMAIMRVWKLLFWALETLAHWSIENLWSNYRYPGVRSLNDTLDSIFFYFSHSLSWF